MGNKMLKCEICGGTLKPFGDKLKCIHCDQVYEKEKDSLTDSEKINMFEDAERLLQMSPPNFDFAEHLFDLIIKKYPTWSAGYWGKVRSKFGIKYEIDSCGKAIPSCYIESYNDIRECEDYKKAILYADEELKIKYKSEAERIAEVCKKWKEISSQFEYEVFICFKATDDETGKDTKDKYEMMQLYYHLISKGFKVFFSPVSLNQRGIYGEKSEPYIFDAIDDCKVMLVYGSKPEYFTSTWMQNEWVRYSWGISKGKKKMNSLIPIYDGFNPVELPQQLRCIQNLNGGTKHFYNDVVEIIENILKKDDEKKETVIPNNKENGKQEKEIKFNNIIYCKKCGSELKQKSKFCYMCGASFETNINDGIDDKSSLKFINCVSCGKKIKEDTKYCYFCGKKIVKEVEGLISNNTKLKSYDNSKKSKKVNVTIWIIIGIIIIYLISLL